MNTKINLKADRVNINFATGKNNGIMMLQRRGFTQLFFTSMIL